MTNEQEKVFWAATREYAKDNWSLAIDRQQLFADPNSDPDIEKGKYAKYDHISGERLPK